MIALACGLVLSSAWGAFAAEQIGQDTAMDRVSDWFATIGKSGMDRDSVIAQRQAARAATRTQAAAERQAKRAQATAEREAKRAQQGLDQAGKELTKSVEGFSN